jgi:hypothetical protein
MGALDNNLSADLNSWYRSRKGGIMSLPLSVPAQKISSSLGYVQGLVIRIRVEAKPLA